MRIILVVLILCLAPNTHAALPGGAVVESLGTGSVMVLVPPVGSGILPGETLPYCDTYEEEPPVSLILTGTIVEGCFEMSKQAVERELERGWPILCAPAHIGPHSGPVPVMPDLDETCIEYIQAWTLDKAQDPGKLVPQIGIHLED